MLYKNMEDEIEYKTEFDIRKLQRTISSVVICWRCKGEGVVEEEEDYCNTHGRLYVNKPCSLCKGDGRLRETLVRTYTNMP